MFDRSLYKCVLQDHDCQQNYVVIGNASTIQRNAVQKIRGTQFLDTRVIQRVWSVRGNKLAQKDTYTPDSAKANMVEHAGSSSRFNSKGIRKQKEEYKNVPREILKRLTMTKAVYCNSATADIRSQESLCPLAVKQVGFRLVFESDKFCLSTNHMYVGKGYQVDAML
ncbi:hypothetical protein Tco_0123290 [Tanacetum coccineum]